MSPSVELGVGGEESMDSLLVNEPEGSEKPTADWSSLEENAQHLGGEVWLWMSNTSLKLILPN